MSASASSFTSRGRLEFEEIEPDSPAGRAAGRGKVDEIIGPPIPSPDPVPLRRAEPDPRQ